MYIIKVVKSTDILALSDTHIAIFQLLQFIFNSLKNEMLVLTSQHKEILIDFLHQLTLKITY